MLSLSCGVLRRALFASGLTLLAGLAPASAAPYIVVDVQSGEVLAENQSFDAWYPASITKLMTVYVTLKAIRTGEIYGDSAVPMTAQGARQAPSKMGFKPGTVVTVDTALKIIMVKSANDVAMALAERVGGGVPGFVERMNASARALGMTNTHFANPNGLPDPNQWTSARDYALLARSLLRDFPEYRGLYGITALSLGGAVIHNHNNLLERYPGTDGMKTGFICAGGFNVVATVTRNGRKLLAVVLGGESAKARDELTAGLIEKAFAQPGRQAGAGVTLDHFRPSGPVNPLPVNIRDIACPKKRPLPSTEDGDGGADGDSQPTSYLVPRFKVMDPVPISLGGARDMPAVPVTTVAVATGAPAVVPPLPLPKPLR